MKRLIPALVFAFLLVPLFSSAQTTHLNANCDLAIFGAKSTKGFRSFDAELRAALAKPDPVAMALLVEYPMRVNEPTGGTYSIDSGEALRDHFPSIFTPQVRKAVETQRLSDLSCYGDQGIGYGNGQVWVELTKVGWAVSAVNVDYGRNTDQRSVPEIEYVCRTEKHSIMVDLEPNNVLRYRAWDAGHSILGKPDLELTGGKAQFGGTGVCAVPFWTFKSGPYSYEVDGAIGCYNSNHPPPQDATGNLTISRHGEVVSSTWCY